MTIFDTLRYPISDLPTIEQLDNLPKEIWKQWTQDCGFASDTLPYQISRWYVILYGWGAGDSSFKEYQLYLARLREIIRNYDNL